MFYALEQEELMYYTYQSKVPSTRDTGAFMSSGKQPKIQQNEGHEHKPKKVNQNQWETRDRNGKQEDSKRTGFTRGHK
ncbi:hypothetical protein Q8A67_009104 [Cirrhinus molitorella]|uniref:Uncharacterized protein n=1 Tax=Cirrhinus molitorella TaxID=172907 RepID=A0AA88Q180_9TELE|nr:hypothetical protein Q8A67_009104 [Cirrhinus molitorella]